MQNMKLRTRFRGGTSAMPQKSAMEDFLFILVISLAVAISMFSKKQQAERFAIPEARPTERVLSTEQYSKLLHCELPEGSIYRVAENDFTHTDELIEFLQQYSSGTIENGILLRTSRTRPIGEIEDLKNLLIDRGWQIHLEWEKQQ